MENGKIIEKTLKALNERKDRSAWSRGVTGYAVEICENLKEWSEGGYLDGVDLSSREECEKASLNGARDWSAFSWGGSSEIYDEDIAKRLCTPSELKKTRNGERKPNAREEWLDTQARALYQAFLRVRGAIREVLKTA